jgi:hypothetical protein
VTLNSHRVIFTAHKFTVLQDTQGHVVQEDMGVFESAKLHLAGTGTMDLDVPILKVAVVKLDVT